MTNGHGFRIGRSRMRVLCAAVLAAAAIHARAENDEAKKGAFDWTDKESGLAFACYAPPNYDSTKAYGLIVALHGHGSTGRDENNGWRYNMGLEQGDFIIACPTLKEFEPEKSLKIAEAVARLLAYLGRVYHTDENRVLLTGFSMGGPVSAAIFFHDSKPFTALALRSSWLLTPGKTVTTRTRSGGTVRRIPGDLYPWVRATPAIGQKPILLIVGSADQFLEETKATQARLAKLPFRDFRYAELPGVKHSSDPAINRPTLEWFRSKTKAPVPSKQ